MELTLSKEPAVGSGQCPRRRVRVRARARVGARARSRACSGKSPMP
jgi:hypothetical protein